MTAARRQSAPPSSVSDGVRAKALRPFEKPRREIRSETRVALTHFEDTARDYEAARTSTRDVGIDVDARPLRRAASTVLDALCREVDDRSGALPVALVADIDRWREGEFAGSEADVEIANHAICELLDSDICAELPPEQ